MFRLGHYKIAIRGFDDGTIQIVRKVDGCELNALLELSEHAVRSDRGVVRGVGGHGVVGGWAGAARCVGEQRVDVVSAIGFR